MWGCDNFAGNMIIIRIASTNVDFADGIASVDT
jgi:hypothetical protein